MNKRKLYSSLLILAASILLFRTIRLLTVEDGWNILANWVIVLTFMEMAIDTLCIIFSFHWLFRDSKKSKFISLRFGASAAFFSCFPSFNLCIGENGTLF